MISQIQIEFRRYKYGVVDWKKKEKSSHLAINNIKKFIEGSLFRDAFIFSEQNKLYRRV